MLLAGHYMHEVAAPKPNADLKFLAGFDIVANSVDLTTRVVSTFTLRVVFFHYDLTFIIFPA
jgi:hypothetical protein